MREIAAETITEAIRDMCIEANYHIVRFSSFVRNQVREQKHQ